MANHEPSNKTDPLWFLDNLEDEETKTTLTENGKLNNAAGEGAYSGIDLSKDSNSTEILNTRDSPKGNDLQEKIIVDEEGFKSELESSLIDLAKESIDQGKSPEFRITISSNNDDLSGGNGKKVDLDSLLFDTNETQSDHTGKGNANTEGKVTSEGEQSLDTNSYNSQNNIKPKIFVILKTNKKTDSNNISLENLKLNENQEIGSTIINLNDFISPQSKQVTGNENISTSVNFTDKDNEKRKVELVITIKDERKPPIKEPETSHAYTNELNTEFPVADSLLGGESLDAKIKRLSDRIQKLSSTTRSLTSDPWQTSKTSRVEGRNTHDDWSETKDSYIREGDGARCYRTVTNTPRGRRVQTQCYKGDRRPARNHHNYGWTSDFGSLWNDLDDEFDRMFSGFNRLTFF